MVADLRILMILVEAREKVQVWFILILRSGRRIALRSTVGRRAHWLCLLSHSRPR
jgi:hypothetical protein